MVLGPAGPGTHSAELHQMSGQRNETDNEEGRDRDEKRDDFPHQMLMMAQSLEMQDTEQRGRTER